MKPQKFHRGDHIRIADDLGSAMRHFPSGLRGFVMGSYRDQYGNGERNLYTVDVEKHGETSWYNEDQLTLIEADDDLRKVESAFAKRRRQQERKDKQ